MTTPQSVLRLSAFCMSGICCLVIVFSPACSAYYWLGIKLYYDHVPLAEAQVIRDVSYDPSAPDDPKRQLDLFLPPSPVGFGVAGPPSSGGFDGPGPSAAGWPVVVFIHGGSWDTGDRRLKVGGADIYANIGRMLASEGFGAAVISYRLLGKDVDWRLQAADVARAVAWVQNNLPERGARAHAVFLMGHSAGAQLATRMAADPQWLERAGGDSFEICGVVGVSGAGYDFGDPETSKLDTDKEFYARRFATSVSDRTWRQDASPARSLDSDDPPFLLMYADDDYRSLMRQSQLIDRQLRKLGISRGLVVVPDADHGTIVLKLSKPKGLAAETILKFLRNTPCPKTSGQTARSSTQREARRKLIADSPVIVPSHRTRTRDPDRE